MLLLLTDSTFGFLKYETPTIQLMHREPNCVEVTVEASSRVVLVGDVHGQLHDVLNLVQLAGPPSSNCIFVFNGDYVDRGAWGFETYIYLLAWKVCGHFLFISLPPIFSTNLCIHLLCCCFLSKFQSLMISIVTGRVLFNTKKIVVLLCTFFCIVVKRNCSYCWKRFFRCSCHIEFFY